MRAQYISIQNSHSKKATLLLTLSVFAFLNTSCAKGFSVNSQSETNNNQGLDVIVSDFTQRAWAFVDDVLRERTDLMHQSSTLGVRVQYVCGVTALEGATKTLKRETVVVPAQPAYTVPEHVRSAWTQYEYISPVKAVVIKALENGQIIFSKSLSLVESNQYETCGRKLSYYDSHKQSNVSPRLDDIINSMPQDFKFPPDKSTFVFETFADTAKTQSLSKIRFDINSFKNYWGNILQLGSSGEDSQYCMKRAVVENPAQTIPAYTIPAQSASTRIHEYYIYSNPITNETNLIQSGGIIVEVAAVISGQVSSTVYALNDTEAEEIRRGLINNQALFLPPQADSLADGVYRIIIKGKNTATQTQNQIGTADFSVSTVDSKKLIKITKASPFRFDKKTVTVGLTDCSQKVVRDPLIIKFLSDENEIGQDFFKFVGISDQLNIQSFVGRYTSWLDFRLQSNGQPQWSGAKNVFFLALPNENQEVLGIQHLFADSKHVLPVYENDQNGKYIKQFNSTADGYEDLARFDKGDCAEDSTLRDQADGWIDSNDCIFTQLRLWQDNDMNGVRKINDRDLFFTLSEKMVQRISLSGQELNLVDRHTESVVHKKSQVITTDGKKHLMFDVWFKQMDQMQCSLGGSSHPEDPTWSQNGFAFDGPGNINGCCQQLDPCGNCNKAYNIPQDEWYAQASCPAEIRLKFGVR